MAELAVLVAIHSFLALGLAISAGATGAPTPRQRVFGLILSLSGIILAAFQLWQAEAASSSAGRLVPRLLLPFWVCLTAWVCWPM